MLLLLPLLVAVLADSGRCLKEAEWLQQAVQESSWDQHLGTLLGLAETDYLGLELRTHLVHSRAALAPHHPTRNLHKLRRRRKLAKADPNT